MSLVTVVNGYTVLRPGLLAHSFTLNRGPLTGDRLDRILEEGITGGYDDQQIPKKEALFMSIHGFNIRYNTSIGGEWGIRRRGSGIALFFTEDLNKKIRNRDIIPDKEIDAYLSELFEREVAKNKMKPERREAEFKKALRSGSLGHDLWRAEESGNTLLERLGVKIGEDSPNRPFTYSSTILDLYATQKMCEGDYSMNITTDSEDGVRAFIIREGVASPLLVTPDYFEGLLVADVLFPDGNGKLNRGPFGDKKREDYLDTLRRIVDGRIPIYLYDWSEEDIPKGAQEVHEITRFGYIPVGDQSVNRLRLNEQGKDRVVRL